MSHKKSAEFVDQFIDVVTLNLNKGYTVRFRLFGTFSIKHKNARVGRNPKTMIEAPIPERNVIKFKVAPTLKKRINDNISFFND